ncbi:prolyl oligopeptidase family serine peptidase [Maricaulis sp.]|uniref:alpha/beta hydrolase family protein n=1 Tax=Maricaulis sp. TaxID=1486257 RepID=UPI002615BE56|nr:prolyl oligopeptidase family serine peptidase [Maricaulis sp.]
MRIISIVLVWFLVVPSVMAQVSVDRFSELPSAWQVEVSPGGTTLAVGCTPRGVREICLYDLSGVEGTKLIPQPDGFFITEFRWVSDRYLVFFVYTVINLSMSSGNHDYGISRTVAYDTSTGQSAILMGDERQYFDLTYIVSVLEGSPDEIAMDLPTFSVSDRCYRTSIYNVDLQTGEMELRERSTSNVDSLFLDTLGNVVAEYRNECGTDDWEIWSRVGERRLVFEGVYEVDRPQIWGLVDDYQAVAVSFPSGENQGLKRVDLETGVVSDLHPAASALINPTPLMDPHSQELIGFMEIEGLRTDTYLDEELDGIAGSLRNALGREALNLTSWSADRRVFTVEATNSGEPSAYYLFDRENGEVTMIATERDSLASPDVPERIEFTYTARDGLEIHSYVTLPPGRTLDEGPFRTILMPHGGPRSQDTAHFDWWAAHYASLGYAVLQANYRGSTGYGLEFEQAGYGEYGDAMVLDVLDVLDGWRALVARNVAAPDGYCAIGASYGGYSALMLGLHAPEETRCIAAINGVTNPYAFISAGRYNDRFTGYWERYWGDRFRGDDERDRITPARRTSDYRAPVLLIHGDEDINVPIGQSRLFRRAMGSRESFRFVVMEGEDHYLRTHQARRTVLEETSSMLEQYLPLQD